jgi:hypothetical protein
MPSLAELPRYSHGGRPNKGIVQHGPIAVNLSTEQKAGTEPPLISNVVRNRLVAPPLMGGTVDADADWIVMYTNRLKD